MSGNEVFVKVETFAEVRFHRQVFDHASARVLHQAAHTGDLLNLLDRTARARRRHHEERVELVHRLQHVLTHVFRGFHPRLQNFAFAFRRRHCQRIVFVAAVGFSNQGFSFRNNFLAIRLDVDVRNRNRNARFGAIFKAQRFDIVEEQHADFVAQLFVNLDDELANRLLVNRRIHELDAVRQNLVEDQAASRCRHSSTRSVGIGATHDQHILHSNTTAIERHNRFGIVRVMREGLTIFFS